MPSRYSLDSTTTSLTDAMSLLQLSAEHDGASNNSVQRLLMVETRSRWESSDVNDFLGLAKGVLKAGLELDLFLMQNSVLLLREAARAHLIELANHTSCRIWVDEFALNLRGLTKEDIGSCGLIAGSDELVQLMAAPNTKTIWHS